MDLGALGCAAGGRDGGSVKDFLSRHEGTIAGLLMPVTYLILALCGLGFLLQSPLYR